MGVRDALQTLGTVVLERLMRVETTVPSPYLPNAVSQLIAKRGQILGFEGADKPSWDRIVALVQQAELGRYATELRTAASGLGTYTAKHERFEVAPERAVAARAAIEDEFQLAPAEGLLNAAATFGERRNVRNDGVATLIGLGQPAKVNSA